VLARSRPKNKTQDQGLCRRRGKLRGRGGSRQRQCPPICAPLAVRSRRPRPVLQRVRATLCQKASMVVRQDGCAPRHASLPRGLARYVIFAHVMMRNCSPQQRPRTRTSRLWRTTRRSQRVPGTKSMPCENSVRPKFKGALPDRENRENHRGLTPPGSNRHQTKSAPTYCPTTTIKENPCA
jgi:hypothetical protein